jgi:septal ring factor EnvC (AmiA/AmiB activator)
MSKYIWMLIVALVMIAHPSALCASSKAKAHSKAAEKKSRVLSARLHNIRVQIHQKKVRIHETRKKEIHASAMVEQVEGRLIGTQKHLAYVKGRLHYLRREHKMLTRRILQTGLRLAARKSLLGQRIRQNYEQGNMSYAQVLLRSRSFNDYLSRSFYVQRIVESDVQLLEGIKADKKQLDEDENTLIQHENEQQSLRQSLESDTARYSADAEQKRSLLHDIQQTRESLEESLDVLEQASNDIEARIRAIEETPQGKIRLQHIWHGSFIRPASGPITSPFGMRYHPILHRYRMHTGVDIGAPYGAPIHAAADGIVIMSGYMRGYGNTLIIDHGGGVSTLYGHCSDLLVSEGARVRQGQVVARVGSTGLATGPHLHFEVRHNGHPVRPF